MYSVDNLPSISAADLELRKWAAQTNCKPPASLGINLCTREKYLKSFTQSPEYFVKRGFSREVLNEFDVRMYPLPGRTFSGRCIVPLYDQVVRHVVGISARTIYDTQPRWIFSDNFPASTSLYGLHKSEQLIRQTHTVILVESPGNVWRLWESGICNVVGIWGVNLGTAKTYLLDKMGVMKVVLSLDNDEAGRAATVKIQNELRGIYNTVNKPPPEGVNDIADMSVEDVKELFNDYRRN